MNPEALICQLGYTHWTIRANSEGVTQEASLEAPVPGGSSLNWVLGHILATRNHFLGLLGREPIWDEAVQSLYSMGSPGRLDPGQARSLETLQAEMDATQESILEGLKEISPEALAAPAPSSPVGNPDETVGSLLAGLVFHEAYHAGQLGILRRLAGMEPGLKLD